MWWVDKERGVIMKKILGVMVVVLLTIGLAACGGSSSGTSSGSDAEGGGSSALTISDVSQLPKATGPMAASGSESVSVKSASTKAATTGMVIGTTDSSFFSSASSPAACEMFNLFKEAINSASQADMIICYVGHMNENFSTGVTDGDGSLITGVDIYDGEYHIFNLNVTGDNEAPSRVKMKLTKNAAGSVNSFEMFMCGGSGENMTQNEYASQTISDENVLEMSARGRHQSAEGSGWHSVIVSGILNNSGAYNSKTIQIENSGEWGSYGPSWEVGTLVQAGDGYSFSGYRANLYNEEVNYDAAYSAGQVLNATSSSPQLMALGDGAANHETSWDESGGGVASWNGDTGLSVESNDYTTAVSSEMVPTASETRLSITFALDQRWECNDDVGVGILTMPEVASSSLSAACSDYSISHDWINCWGIIGD